MIREALLILSALVAATAEAAEWQVSERLIGEGARIEDSGTTLVEIRWVVPLGPDAFAFWAKYGPERQQGGLYLWREGRPVTTVVLDGGTLSAPGSQASAKFIIDSSKWGRHTLRHPSGPRYFLSPLRGATGADVFALGADGIEKILAKGDRIPIGDKTAGVTAARVISVDNIGRAVMRVKTKRGVKGESLVLSDGNQLTVLATHGRTLPGPDGAVVADITPGSLTLETLAPSR